MRLNLIYTKIIPVHPMLLRDQEIPLELNLFTPKMRGFQASTITAGVNIAS